MSRTHVLTLPGGLLTRDGEVHREVEIQELSGQIQVNVFKAARNDPGSALQVLLRSCVNRIGPIAPVEADHLQDLLNGDVDYTLLRLYRHTFGPKLGGAVKCGNCSKEFPVSVDIDAIPSNELRTDVTNQFWEYDYDAESWKPGAVEIEQGERRFWVRDVDLGIEACFKYPTAREQKKIFKLLDQNPLQGIQYLYFLCLRSWNGQTERFIPEIISDLGAGTLEFLDDVFTQIPPGPASNAPVSCVYCGFEQEVSLNATDFLSRLLGRQMSAGSKSTKRRRSLR